MDDTLTEMAKEGLIVNDDGQVKLTEQGTKLGKDWQSLLLKKEPILEVVAGLVDGSITGLVVILSASIAFLEAKLAAFAAFLTLTAVAITNFSSFLLGGITEDMADMITLQNLMNYSLSDISDKGERDRSLRLVKQLFMVLHKEIQRSNPLRGNNMRHNNIPCRNRAHHGLPDASQTNQHSPISKHSCACRRNLPRPLPLQTIKSTLENNALGNRRHSSHSRSRLHNTRWHHIGMALNRQTAAHAPSSCNDP